MKTPYIHSPNLNGDTGFPYLVLDVVNDNAVPRNPGFQVMHWHEDLQFICVPDGEITLQTLEETVEIPRETVFSSTRTSSTMSEEKARATTTASFSPSTS